MGIYRIFDGKRYSGAGIKNTKEGARDLAESLRSKGYNARVIKIAGGYRVLARKG